MEYTFWKVPQIMYKNPHVQVVNLVNQFPTPFIRCWMDNGDDVIIDVFNKSMEEIEEHMIKILGKTREQLREEREEQREINNPAFFGQQSLRHCICEIPGQMPCPALVEVPKYFTGSYYWKHCGKKVE
ncbi:MRPS25 [Cordylochernes scorpioides]|uniref:MRPS25 n=1 Tax=Cordylochernes scorpioides TaxID=51811 RepID=A0ABY6L073_9ARAC|nr:MRPS25 [Cordylochernes scorpioides]